MRRRGLGGRDGGGACAAVVGDVDVGAGVVVIAYAVVVVDGVVPACGVPAHGTVEVVECAE